ncbi:hypothetical protein FQN49_007272 [Arthroderma sp. PD_2]|nr:hypothetical protein FQN49_007272 [Arthroderma sp. PD_2]
MPDSSQRSQSPEYADNLELGEVPSLPSSPAHEAAPADGDDYHGPRNANEPEAFEALEEWIRELDEEDEERAPQLEDPEVLEALEAYLRERDEEDALARRAEHRAVHLYLTSIQIRHGKLSRRREQVYSQVLSCGAS